jgi:hypothetical protein
MTQGPHECGQITRDVYGGCGLERGARARSSGEELGRGARARSSGEEFGRERRARAREHYSLTCLRCIWFLSATQFRLTKTNNNSNNNNSKKNEIHHNMKLTFAFPVLLLSLALLAESATMRGSVTEPIKETSLDKASHEERNLQAGCEPNGGSCWCGNGGDGGRITMNRFWGDFNDEKVEGCGGAFRLATVGGSAEFGSDGQVSGSVGVQFVQEASYDGWEGCCNLCGTYLQAAGRLSSGWYCEKDFFSTGIWLKGVNTW